ncbi:MAG: RNA polymerase sigma factor region1.1 domain-containing protein, partial [Geminicoccaceae bacterium]
MAITVKAPFQKDGLGGSVQALVEKSADLRKLVLEACERGSITVDQINAALLIDDISPELLEELLGAFDK